MARLDTPFDANTVEPNKPFEVIPDGDYNVQIITSEMQATKNGNGKYLKLEMEILDGPHKGQHLFDRLNLDNPNPKAVEIAQRTLSAICHATGQLSVTDSEQLHFKPLAAKVTIKPEEKDEAGNVKYAANNEVKGYKPLAGAGKAIAPRSPSAGASTSQPAPPAPAQQEPVGAGVSGAAPPWKR